MKHIPMRRAANVLLTLALVAGLLGFAVPVAADAPEGVQTSYMPPEPGKIAAALVEEGVIPADATPEQVDAAVTAYLQTKLQDSEEIGNPMASKRLQANEEALNTQASGDIRGRKLGKKVEVAPSSPTFKPLEGADKLLLILVQFSDTPYTWTTNAGEERTEAGPMHNQIPVPDNSFDLYVPDFSTEHFEDMLFTPGGWTMPSDAPRYAGEHRGSMRDYYLEQSFGQYTVDGQAYGWYTVDKPEAYYGDDSVTGHDNLGPGTMKDLLADAVAAVNAAGDINWADYDQQVLWSGLGGDETCDCVIDHPLFIHAGIDQSGGGGAQGTDSIWAHSSSRLTQVSPPDSVCPLGRFIYNYTIMPEDGGVGVFAHEFGHDLGLPDEYDTAYSGDGDSVGFWSLMSSGSWVGQPAQTQPPDMSIWARYSLGWLTEGDNLARVNIADLGSDPLGLRIEQSARYGGEGTFNGLRIDLPPQVAKTNTPYSGSWEWFGGKGDEIDTTLRRTVDLTGKSSATLSFWTWYDIEPQWDYGFVQVSTDDGATWTSLPIDGTTDDIVADGYPEIIENMPGFTGNSGGWVFKTYDLPAEYLDKEIQLQFRYMTDWGTTMAGFYVDDITVTADGATVFADDVENEDAAWTADGWMRDQGQKLVNHYYIAEWRNLNALETPYGDASIVNFNNGLTNVYQFKNDEAIEPWYFSYAPGLLLYYRNMAYSDNWTGAHPGAGYLLVVDAHDRPLLMPRYGAPWRSRVQTYDSTFSLDGAPTIDIGYWDIAQTIKGMAAVPSFDDSLSYWNQKAPAASVQTPTYGFVFRVLGQAEDGSAAVIGLGTK